MDAHHFQRIVLNLIFVYRNGINKRIYCRNDFVMSGTLYTKSRRFYSTSNDVKGMREYAYINTLSPSYLEIQYILNSNLHSFNKQKKY